MRGEGISKGEDDLEEESVRLGVEGVEDGLKSTELDFEDEEDSLRRFTPCSQGLYSCIILILTVRDIVNRGNKLHECERAYFNIPGRDLEDKTGSNFLLPEIFHALNQPSLSPSSF